MKQVYLEDYYYLYSYEDNEYIDFLKKELEIRNINEYFDASCEIKDIFFKKHYELDFAKKTIQNKWYKSFEYRIHCVYRDACILYDSIFSKKDVKEFYEKTFTDISFDSLSSFLEEMVNGTLAHLSLIFKKMLSEHYTFSIDKFFYHTDFVARGCSFRRECWHNLLGSVGQQIENSYIQLIPEPDNEYDPNAILLMARGEVFGKLGYVAKHQTNTIHKILSIASNYYIEIPEVKDKNFKDILLTIHWNI